MRLSLQESELGLLRIQNLLTPVATRGWQQTFQRNGTGE
jgi:hypothetical protein